MVTQLVGGKTEMRTLPSGIQSLCSDLPADWLGWEAQALVSSNNIYINNNNSKTLFSNYDQNLVGMTHNNEGYEGYLISGTSISGVQMGIKHMPSPQ